MNENIKTETRLVRHEFTQTERLQLGTDLAQNHRQLQGIEAEFEGVKANFKARIAEAESRIETLATDIGNGFTMRQKNCKVVLRPKDRKKDFYAEIKDGVFEAKPVITEDMTTDDFQQELFEAESRFERRAEIPLFKDAVLVVGRLKGKWFSALRVRIGQQKLEERLAPDADKFKARPDAIKATVIRLEKWVTQQFGAETWKGFADAVSKVVKTHETLEE